jgi:hypothetical protein
LLSPNQTSLGYLVLQKAKYEMLLSSDDQAFSEEFKSTSLKF